MVRCRIRYLMTTEATVEDTITQLLSNAASGDQAARDEVFLRVQGELRRIAQTMLGGRPAWKSGLQATEIVSLACIKLLEGGRLEPESKRHFFFLLTRAMGDVLRDEEDRARAAKRGGKAVRVPLTEFAVDDVRTSFAAGDLLQALDELRRLDPDAARVAELRFLAGRTLKETSELLSMSVASVRGNWAYAQAWLAERLDPLCHEGNPGARGPADPG